MLEQLPDGFPPPPPELHTDRAICAAEIGGIMRMVPYVNLAGLTHARNHLKSADVVRLCTIGGQLAEFRVEALADVCKRMAAMGEGSIETFIALGDIPPSAPDYGPDEGL